MSPQTVYAIKQAAVLAGIAGLAVVIEQVANIVPAGADPSVAIIVTAVLGSALRVLEGIRDGQRATKGLVIPADVAYVALEKQAVHGDRLAVTPVLEANYTPEPKLIVREGRPEPVVPDLPATPGVVREIQRGQ